MNCCRGIKRLQCEAQIASMRAPLSRAFPIVSDRFDEHEFFVRASKHEVGAPLVLACLLNNARAEHM